MLPEERHPNKRRAIEWPENAAVSRERWITITDRLISAHARGLTLNRLSRATGIDAGWFDIFVTQPEVVRGNSKRIYSNQPTEFEERTAAIEAHLAEFETDFQKLGEPSRIETTVTRSVCEGIAAARAMTSVVLIDAAPGLGKTEGFRYYIEKARLSEGFSCPVWPIELDEYSLSHKAILGQIAGQTIGRNRYDERTESAMSNAISDATEGRNGVLIVDEAQHLGDATRINGIAILNGLRRFVDRRCFGLVLIGNGEIYRRLSAGKHAQLLSRMEHRIEIEGLSEKGKTGRGSERFALQEADVREIASAWGVTDVKGITYSLEIARQAGAIRLLTSVYRRALRDYGEINYATMTVVKKR